MKCTANCGLNSECSDWIGGRLNLSLQCKVCAANCASMLNLHWAGTSHRKFHYNLCQLQQIDHMIHLKLNFTFGIDQIDTYTTYNFQISKPYVSIYDDDDPVAVVIVEQELQLPTTSAWAIKLVLGLWGVRSNRHLQWNVVVVEHSYRS